MARNLIILNQTVEKGGLRFDGSKGRKNNAVTNS